MLVEHARELAGIADATHAEYGAGGSPVISMLACSLVATEIEIEIVPGTRLAEAHGSLRATEPTNCSYGLSPAFEHIASAGGLIVSARDDTGEVRAVERTDHPFYVGTLYQPQRRSAPDDPHPLLLAFIDAVLADT